MAGHWQEKQCPKAPARTHNEIQKEYPDALFCLYCGTAWAIPIPLDSDYETPSPRTQSRSSSSQVIPPSRTQRDRTSNFTKTFRAKAQEALQAARPSVPKDPYEHPSGLFIRLIPLISIGSVRGGFFIPKEITKLGAYKEILF